MPLATYRRYLLDTLKGVRWAASTMGERLVGGLGLGADLVAEGLRQAFISGLPGHPECMEDSLDQIGLERADLPKFRHDIPHSWRHRIQNAWTTYEQAGTAVKLRELVNEFLSVTAGGGFMLPTLLISDTNVFEGDDGPMTVNVEINTLPSISWALPPTYGGGFVFGGTSVLYGMQADAGDIAQLKALIRKFKRAATHAKITLTGLTTLQV